MKKLLFFALLCLAIGACNNENSGNPPAATPAIDDQGKAEDPNYGKARDQDTGKADRDTSLYPK